MNPDLIGRYGKVLARMLSGSTDAEKSTAREILKRLEQKNPGLREAFVARTMAAKAAAKAKTVTSAAAAAWASTDPAVQAATRMGQAHLDRAIDAALQGLVDMVTDFFTPGDPPVSAEPATDDLLAEYGDFAADLDPDDDVEMLVLEISFPLECWDTPASQKKVLAWLRDGITEAITALENEEDEDDEDDNLDDLDDDGEGPYADDED